MAETAIPEPADGTRLEFEHNTDVYAFWRDDESSRIAGYPVGDGGEVWCEYGRDVPTSWSQMVAEFGDSLRLAIRLVPVPEDEPNRRLWPTTIYRTVGDLS